MNALRSYLRLALLWLPLPSRWRLPLFDALYRLAGSRFRGQAHYEAWQRSRLPARPAAPSTTGAMAGPRAGADAPRRTVVIVDQYIPRPDRDAGSRAVWQVIETFIAQGWAVRFWPNYLWYEPGYTERLQDMGVQVVFGAGGPRRFGAWLQAMGDSAAAVFLVRPLIAREYIPLVRRFSRARVMFCGHDIQYQRLAQMAQALGRPPGAEQRWMARLEPRIWARSDIVYYPSDTEVQTVRQRCPHADVRLLPLYTFTTFGTPRPAQATPLPALLIVANFGHAPNVDGVQWFVRDVLPLLRRRCPAFVLNLVGADPPPEAAAMAGSGVNWLGAVTDAELDRLYQGSQAALVPLRFGAGVKGKVVESLRWGLPLVTTSIGIQGMAGLARIVSVADTPETFADAVRDLLADPGAAARMSAGMIEFARSHFARDITARALAL